MFKLDEEEGYWYPVTLELVDGEGKKRKGDFDAYFARLQQSEITELLSREEGDEPIKDQDICDKVFLKWRKVQGADGSELAVTDENRAKLLDIFPVRPNVVRAWLKSIGIEGRSKN
jgi:hypothetical protein